MGGGQPTDWALIADLRPQLHQHVKTYPQDYRGDRWYVLHDASTGRHLRFNELAYAFIGRLDGELSVQEICHSLSSALGEDTLNQGEVIMILAQLYTVDVLKADLPVESKEYFKRYQKGKPKRVFNPLAVRFPLYDPDTVLNRLVVLVRPLFSWGGMVLWSIVVGIAFLLALVNLDDLIGAVNRDMLAPVNIVSMVLLYTLVKMVHEFSHALTVKLWGGEVHEMGITLLVFAPIFYVDATGAWAFRDKRKRMLVGAAGIMAELLVAALALMVWLAVEPGLVRSAALNVMLIGSISTLLFNANPLLRFDGYYVLQDLVEIPNLSARCNRYYIYLIQRYLFGLPQAQSPETAEGERAWFVCYGLAAFVYRMFILTVIVMFLVSQYQVIGVAIAAWAVATQILMPLFKGIRFLILGPMLQYHRGRAGAVTLLLVGGLSALLFYVPVSLTTRADGVVWVPDQAQVYAETAGFVEKVLVTSGDWVDAGTPLLQMRDPELVARIAVLEAQRRMLVTRAMSEWMRERVQSQITREEQAAVEAELKLVEEQAAGLLVHSRVDGTVVLPEGNSLRGIYLRQGEMFGYVSAPDHLIVRSVVSQADIGLVRRKVSRVQVRLAESLATLVEARIVRETPAGSKELPSAALGTAGGGNIAVTRETSRSDSRTAVDRFFHVDLELPAGLDVSGLGGRAYVRFEHGAEPLAMQWMRSIRQLFLSRLSM